MNYAFGPVPSRRLGQSLGIDTIPLKTCNWNCVYCQLGRTLPLTNERREYIPRDEILAEVKSALASHKPGEIDWITFVGSGEPTFHSGMGWLIRQVKAVTKIPVAVITNGTLLYLPEVREELSEADAVLPTLDAGNAADKMIQSPKVNILWSHEPRGFEKNGEKMIVKAENLKSKEMVTLERDGVFIFVGMLPNVDLLRNTPLQLNKYGYIVTNENMETNIEGVYAAGDVRDKKYRQIATAGGDGTVASLEVIRKM